MRQEKEGKKKTHKTMWIHNSNPLITRNLRDTEEEKYGNEDVVND